MFLVAVESVTACAHSPSGFVQGRHATTGHAGQQTQEQALKRPRRVRAQLNRVRLKSAQLKLAEIKRTMAERNRPRIPTTLSVSASTVADGWLVNVANCSASLHTWSSYTCFSLNLGHQNETIIASDTLLFGVRFRPSDTVSLTSGLGFGLIGALVNAITCTGKEGFRSNKQDKECDRAYLPMHISPSFAAHFPVTTLGQNLIVDLTTRYHFSVAGEWVDFQAPSGLAFAAGVSLKL
ncbi:MAG: hypothetical protein JKY56_02440 [Kofleriaceae bacterium]|nr:hypothetical protein [Kofleriaceae bacterium]